MLMRLKDSFTVNTQPSKFSQWIRYNLKDSFSGLIAQDIDFFIKNKNGQTFVIEEKRNKFAKTGPAQAVIYKLIDEVCSFNTSFQGVLKITDISENFGFLNQTTNVDIVNFLEYPKSIYDLKNQWYENIITNALPYLWDCTGIPKTGRNTAPERTFIRNSNLAPLLTANGFKYTTIEWIFVNYCSGNFAFFYESKPDDLTLEFIEMFKRYDYKNNVIFNPKSNKNYNFLGHYLINYEADFSKFKLNENTINKNDAITILNLDNDSILDYL